MAGVEGAGQRELLRALAGRRRPTRGLVETHAEVGFVPEDRHHDAMVLDFTLAENVALRGAGRRRGLVRWDAIGAETAALLTRHDVRADGGPRALARTLSGGNQQKLVLARELEGAGEEKTARDGDDRSRHDAAALVVESPTRGLDIRASAAVHERLRAARDADAAIVLYSSDVDELLSLADRVLVCYGGRLREVARDRDAVGRAMLGVAEAEVE